jgi:hypothetical protein
MTMKPDATWGYFLEALSDGDRDLARQHFKNLQRWLGDGGYAPNAGQRDRKHLLALMDLLVPLVPAANQYTVFVQQDDGRGTTNISVYEAANCEEAEKLALIQAAADWNSSPDKLRTLGNIKGDVEVLKWEDLDGEPERGPRLRRFSA